MGRIRQLCIMSRSKKCHKEKSEEKLLGQVRETLSQIYRDLPAQICMASLVAQTAKQCWRPGFSLRVGKIPWRRKWQPSPVLLPGKFHGQRSSPWGRKELDMTEQLHFKINFIK